MELMISYPGYNFSLIVTSCHSDSLDDGLLIEKKKVLKNRRKDSVQGKKKSKYRTQTTI